MSSRSLPARWKECSVHDGVLAVALIGDRRIGPYMVRDPASSISLRTHVTMLREGVAFDRGNRVWEPHHQALANVMSVLRDSPEQPRYVIDQFGCKVLISPTIKGGARIGAAGKSSEDAFESAMDQLRIPRRGDRGSRFVRPEVGANLICAGKERRSTGSVAEPSAWITVPGDFEIALDAQAKVAREWYRHNRLHSIINGGGLRIEVYDIDTSQNEWVAAYAEKPAHHAFVKSRLPEPDFIERFSGYVVYHDQISALTSVDGTARQDSLF